MFRGDGQVQVVPRTGEITRRARVTGPDRFAPGATTEGRKMKPCRKNRRPIAWLVLGELPEDEARRLNQHFETCPGCRGYWRELADIGEAHSRGAGSLEVIKPSPEFHSRWLGAIVARREGGQAVPGFRWWRPGWSVARLDLIPAACVLVGLGTMALVYFRPTTGPSESAPAPAAAPSTADAGGRPPSLGEYRMALNRSLDSLDRLLAEPPGHGVTWRDREYSLSQVIRRAEP